MKFKEFMKQKVNANEILSRRSLRQGLGIKRPVPVFEKLSDVINALDPRHIYSQKDKQKSKRYGNAIKYHTKIPNKNCSLFIDLYSDGHPLAKGKKRANFIVSVLKMISKNPYYKYILCVDLGDQAFQPEFTKLIPNNLIRIFSLNANVNHNKVVSFPLGIIEYGSSANDYSFQKTINRCKKKKKNKLVCCGPFGTGKWSVYYPHNNLERLGKRDRERVNLLKCMSKKAWVDVQFDKMPVNEYFDYLSNYKFVISPEGKGVDCHRTWEALYMNSVPIVQDSLHMRSFKDLPILFVNNYEELNEDYLEMIYDEMLEKEYNFNKLKKFYWDNLVKNEIQNLNLGTP